MKCDQIGWMAAFVLLCASLAQGQTGNRGGQAGQLASEVRRLFAEKCAECHSAKLARPKGKFGYVLDLHRMAGNPKLVVPFNADQSQLWQKIEDGQMPPEDAKGGPLSNQQKALVRWWIEAGAAASAGAGAASIAAEPHPDQPPALGARLLRWMGRFHVLVIHFPIALLVAAAVAESWWMWEGRAGMSPAVRYCVLLGALGAIVAAGLGWVRAPFSGYGGAQALFLHRWAGTAAGACALAAAIASEHDVLRHRRSRIFRAALFASALMIGAAGHLGGTLVYGDGYFAW